MPSPLIGLTTYRHLNQYGLPLNSITEAYVRAVSNAGALPTLIPLGLAEETLDALLARLDGILFTGGGDVAPERYGSQPHPLVDDVDADRDRVEVHLLQRTLEQGLPFLGICRGLQVINVALGGTLFEDILDQRPNSLKHQYYPNWPRNYLAHYCAGGRGQPPGTDAGPAHGAGEQPAPPGRPRSGSPAAGDGFCPGWRDRGVRAGRASLRHGGAVAPGMAARTPADAIHLPRICAGCG